MEKDLGEVEISTLQFNLNYLGISKLAKIRNVPNKNINSFTNVNEYTELIYNGQYDSGYAAISNVERLLSLFSNATVEELFTEDFCMNIFITNPIIGACYKMTKSKLIKAKLEQIKNDYLLEFNYGGINIHKETVEIITDNYNFVSYGFVKDFFMLEDLCTQLRRKCNEKRTI